MPDRPFVYRFTNDLRLDDHAGLAAAATHGAVIPLLVIDESVRSRLTASRRRAAYFCAAAASLDSELRERGSRLFVRRGAAAAAVTRFARDAGAAGVAWSASYDAASMENDGSVRSELEERGVAAVLVHDAPAVAPEESAAERSVDGGGYRAFAPYFDVWSELPVTSYEHPLLLRFAESDAESEALPSSSEFGGSARAFAAGSSEARRGFERFLRDEAAQYSYAAHAPAEDRTSRLSPHLSFGTISARFVVRRIRERLADPFALSEERLSLRRYLRAVAHRDFFLQLGWFYPRTRDEPLQERMAGFEWERSHPGLDAWRTGNTGYPLVDAGMRQLRDTGWMHPHVRAVAASYLCFDLGVDWRLGRAEWDRWLIEDDAALATGNWQWIAGVGADMAQYPRIYNPERQRRRFDPGGTYVRRWIPELADVPIDAWHGRDGDSGQLKLALYAGREYPRATIDHAVAARAFLRRYRAFISS